MHIIIETVNKRINQCSLFYVGRTQEKLEITRRRLLGPRIRIFIIIIIITVIIINLFFSVLAFRSNGFFGRQKFAGVLKAVPRVVYTVETRTFSNTILSYIIQGMPSKRSYLFQNWRKKYPFSNISGYEWTRPEVFHFLSINL